MPVLRILTILWLAIFLFLGFEYAILHNMIRGESTMELILCKNLRWCRSLDTEPGKMLSYALGWAGFGIMCLTNVYVIRKRVDAFQKFGSIKTHLDWHIFFGLLGPTLILFHCDFKVGGLVAISFWSMVISFASGVVGRYFYLQLLQQKNQLKRNITALESGFDKYMKLMRGQIQKKHMDLAKSHAFALACGGVSPRRLNQVSLFEFLMRSLIGDISLRIKLPPVPWRGNRSVRQHIRTWAFLRRKLIFMHYYHLLFGYWRTFHSPFAVFMYVVAIIHIISSLIFKVH